MNFNVEDILALPQLQEGRLNKNILCTDIFQSVKEVKAIQEWSAQQKNVTISSKFFGFHECDSIGGSQTKYLVDIDEQRFQ